MILNSQNHNDSVEKPNATEIFRLQFERLLDFDVTISQ